MYADRTTPRSVGVERSAKERLGTRPAGPPPAPRVDPRAPLKRKRQDDTTWSNEILGERVVKDNVPKELKASMSQNDVLRSSRDRIRSLTESSQKNFVIDRTALVNANPTGEAKGASATKSVSAKRPMIPPASAPTPGEKKQVVAEELNVAAFLQRLGLSKYHITFQAEEVDMFALKHMNEDDLKAIGLPMGPRKKILHALAPAKAQK